MRFVNWIVFIGLLLCGVALLLGIVLDKGSWAGLATYFGWFLGTFSLIAYLVASVMFLLNRMNAFWHSLYPTNFGLTLLGVSAFGINVKQEVTILIICLLTALSVSFLLYRSGLLANKLSPSVIVALLFVPAIPPIMPVWGYIYFVLGIMVIASSLFTATNMARPHRETKLSSQTN